MTQADIKRAQARFCEMGKSIAGILEQNGIPYIITFGTLLGAVRHKGFIPWDYDFDFFLFDDSYQDAMDVLRKSLPPDMFLEDEISEPLYFHGWAHVKDLRSQVRRTVPHQDDLYAHQGLSVDLYRCKRMRMKELCEYRKQESKAYLERKLSHQLITPQEMEAQYRALCAGIERESDGTEDGEEEIFAMAMKERYMRCSDVFPLRKYAFGDYEFWGPHDADAVLTHFYGNYMTPPPERERVLPYEVIFKD